MSISFVRFDNKEPQAQFGESLLEYIGKGFNKYFAEMRENQPEATPRDAYKALSKVWRGHHPPQGIKGIYAFVNTPRNITRSVIPVRIWQPIWDAAMKKFEYVPDYFRRMDEAMEFIMNHPEKMPGAYVYQITQVRRVFAHYRGGKKQWVCFKASEFEAHYDEDIYEVFLELKS